MLDSSAAAQLPDTQRKRLGVSSYYKSPKSLQSLTASSAVLKGPKASESGRQPGTHVHQYHPARRRASSFAISSLSSALSGREPFTASKIACHIQLSWSACKKSSADRWKNSALGMSLILILFSVCSSCFCFRFSTQNKAQRAPRHTLPKAAASETGRVLAASGSWQQSRRFKQAHLFADLHEPRIFLRHHDFQRPPVPSANNVADASILSRLPIQLAPNSVPLGKELV